MEASLPYVVSSEASKRYQSLQRQHSVAIDIYIIKRKVCMYVPTFWLCLLTDFRAKYTYGLLMTQGVSEKYKIAYFQEKIF